MKQEVFDPEIKTLIACIDRSLHLDLCFECKEILLGKYQFLKLMFNLLTIRSTLFYSIMSARRELKI